MTSIRTRSPLRATAIRSGLRAMRARPPLLPRAVLALLLCGPVASSLLAETTGQLSGVVRDTTGSPLRAVAITAGSPAQIGGLQITTSDAEGRFSYPRLMPGSYTVRFELEGFVIRELTSVQVRLDHLTELQVVLPRGEIRDEIDVVETTPVVDTEQVSTGQTFTGEYLQETAATWVDALVQAAGVMKPWAPGGTVRRVLGSTPQDNTFLLDGLDVTHWGERLANASAFNLPFDAVQEASVQTAGFEAEYGHATGGVVNVVTRSGGNRFAATLDLRYTGSDLETAGEHWDPDEQVSEERRLTATLGGPLRRDRLWFFVTYDDRVGKLTPTGAPTTSDWDFRTRLLKLTWQASPSWSLVGKVSSTPLRIRDASSSPFRAAEATSTIENEPEILSLELLGMFTSSLLWDLRLGSELWPATELPTDGDLTTIGHVNGGTQESYGNFVGQYHGDSTQAQVESDLSWLVDGLAGSHELQAGVRYGEPKKTVDECLNGGGRCVAAREGFFFVDGSDGSGGNSPLQFIVQEARGPITFAGAYQAAYVQDTWRVRPELTLKLGLRTDRVTFDNDTGEVARLSKLQPRLGAAWDVQGNGRTVLRASWGRFMHPGNLLLPEIASAANTPAEVWLSCSRFVSGDPGRCAAVSEASGLGYRGDPEGWDRAGWFLLPDLVFASSPTEVVDGLATAYADEWIVGVERELFRRTSVELSYVHKSHADLFDDTCEGNVPVPTPGAPCDVIVVANLPQLRLDYEGWLLRFESRALDRLHLIASWVTSSSQGSLETNTANTNNFDLYPYHFENRYGYLPDHSRHRVKLHGYLRLPYDLGLAWSGWWDSELRWTPTQSASALPEMPFGVRFAEPRGNRKAGGLHQLDLQLAKGFRIGRSRLELIGKVINLLDAERAYGICENTTGCGDFAMGEAIAWLQPRRYQIGVRFEWN